MNFEDNQLKDSFYAKILHSFLEELSKPGFFISDDIAPQFVAYLTGCLQKSLDTAFIAMESEIREKDEEKQD